jgi:hypothetical protein
MRGVSFLIIEGYLKLQSNGRYAVCGRESSYELTCGECVDVRTGNHWLSMRIEHDGTGYYLLADKLAFYPKVVYAQYDTSFRRF